MLLYYQSDDTKYEYDRIKRMYEKEVAEAKRRGLTVQEDGLPDASRVDCDLNYHLELVDLLGMCAKGRNEFTEKYVRAYFSEEDVMRVLGDTERVPTLIKSPFVRVLHGVYFSAVTDDADADDATTTTSTAGGVEVMKRYWSEFVRLFASFEADISRFRLWIKRDQSEKEKAEKEAAVAKGEAVEGDDDAAADDDAPDADEEAALRAFGEMTEENEDAVWDLLENYIFYVVTPFLTDFYSSSDARGNYTFPLEGSFAGDVGGNLSSSESRGDALIVASRSIAKTLRKMVKLEYVTGCSIGSRPKPRSSHPISPSAGT